MAVFTVKVPEGELSKAIRQISAWDGKTRLRVEAALKRGTNAVYREARQRVPIRSGKLKKSIRQRFSTVKLEGQVFSNQPYAHLVEFGSRGSADEKLDLSRSQQEVRTCFLMNSV